MSNEVIERTLGSQMSTEQKLAYARWLKRECERGTIAAKRFYDDWIAERAKQRNQVERVTLEMYGKEVR